MSKITFFSNKEEGDPENGLAQPYASLRDWRDRDERRLPAFKNLRERYPEAFSQQATNRIIEERRRAIYPEAYDRAASIQYELEQTKLAEEPASKLEEKKISYKDIPQRVFDIVHRMARPRKMSAPAISYIAGTKIKRVKMPGFSRTEVRDAIRALLNHL